MENALERQVGGDHYKKAKVQPILPITELKMNFHQGSMLKYVARYKDKNGLQDLQKVVHYAELGKELGPTNFVLQFKTWKETCKVIDDYCTKNGYVELVNLIMKFIALQDWTQIKVYTNKLIDNYEAVH